MDQEFGPPEAKASKTDTKQGRKSKPTKKTPGPVPSTLPEPPRVATPPPDDDLGPRGKTIWDDDPVKDTPEELRAAEEDPTQLHVQGDELKTEEELPEVEVADEVVFTVDEELSKADALLMSVRMDTQAGVRVVAGTGPAMKDHVTVQLPPSLAKSELAHKIDAILARERIMTQQQLAAEVTDLFASSFVSIQEKVSRGLALRKWN